MRIAIDARELQGQPTGVGTYLSRLLDVWRRSPEARRHEWRLYVPQTAGGRRQPDSGSAVPAGDKWQAEGEGAASSRLQPSAGAGSPEPEAFAILTVPGRGDTWWEQRALATAIRSDRPDVLFAPGYTAPLRIGTVPVVVTVHDVSFFAHPEWFGRREGFRRRLLTRLAARKARMVLTVSQVSRDDIVRSLGVMPQRVRVIYHGIERPAGPSNADGRPPMVLFVGSIFNRRRVPDLVQAFAALLPDVPDATLEIVGDNRTHPRQDLAEIAASSGAAGRVHLHSYVGDEELGRLYDTASAFGFLSEYEGFGFTPLEALAHDVPIVVLDTPVAREIYRDAAVFVRAGDVEGTTAALRVALQDRAARAAQIERGRRLLERYSWDEAARQTLAAIEEAAGHRG